MIGVLWPGLLLSLLLVPLLVAAYVWMLRRRNKYAVRYSSLALIREALPKRSRWRRHLPFVLLLLGLTSLLTAFARPVALVKVPLSRTTIVLALDVSRSMCATDVRPNRLTVAQDAVLAFIDGQPDGTQIGVVAFADFAELVVPPTSDKEVLRDAIANLTTALGTAIGSATLKSIDAIAENNVAVAPSGLNLPAEENEPEPNAVYQPDIIVLLTDGANTQGPNPLDAARKAAGRQLRVYTIGFGTSNPGPIVCSQRQLGSDVFGGGFGGGFGTGGFGGGGFLNYLVIDEKTLQTVADLTGGSYYRAEDAGQLLDVFLDLPSQIVLQDETVEISVLFVALGILVATAAVGLSLWWHRYQIR
jgi:Ca-activated chloride channel family protein